MGLKKVVIRFNENQEKLVREFLEDNSIEMIGKVKDAYKKRGRPTKFDKEKFILLHKEYLEGKLSSTEFRNIFRLEESSFYNKLQTLGLMTRKKYRENLKENDLLILTDKDAMFDGLLDEINRNYLESNRLVDMGEEDYFDSDFDGLFDDIDINEI